ncbi:L,D-transpeptidase [Rhodopseudomonas palustris]|uniref:L,D-transpeptidase n=1 Tax=Rhodopseudomonas palustris TaxID=1076 RepID=UPI0006427CC0|nr:L,D-transpeptidase [Rhodopseudomonas palustris]
MRSYLVSLTGLILLAVSTTAEAKVAITVDKDNQQLTVAVDGVERYRWPVSTGNPSHETPNGNFQAFRMEADHYSKEFDDAPMPHSIFFTKRGHAIHGTDAAGKLGVPVSHGCVRLSRDNAATLFALVQKEGVLNTTVTLSGSSQVALARLKTKNGNAVARAEPAPAAPSYDAAGELLPSRPRAVRPRVADDGYIYPAEGGYDDRRYPAPPGYRRVAPPQYGYYVDNDSYAEQIYAPRRYYQPRGWYEGGYSSY